MKRRGDLWSDPADEKLKALVADERGLSFSAIAAEMQDVRPGTSRNAAIGRAARLKFTKPNNATPNKRIAKPRMITIRRSPEVAPKIETREQAIEMLNEKPSAGVSFNDVTGCWAPLSGDGLTARFCNEKRQAGCSYCPAHNRLFTTRRVEARRRY